MYPTIDELKALLTDPAGLRFAAKLAPGPVPEHDPDLGPCVLWTGTTNPRGYGSFRDNGKMVMTHRWLFMRLHGPVPEGKQLHHLCHDPETCKLASKCPHRACVVHTVPATSRENTLAGASALAELARRTRCNGKYSPPGGHDLTDPANVYVQTLASGAQLRHCLPCNRAAGRAYAARVRARKRAQRAPASVQLTLV